MRVKRMKRPVRELDTDPQREIFAPAAVEANALSPAGEGGGRRFRDPNPESIYIGNEPLRDYLTKMEMGWVLLVRQTLRALDWSPFEEKYKTTGRAPYAPAALMGLILYGTMQGKTSLRQLEVLARSDLGCMWISGQIFPDHSVIGRFIAMHAELITETFFEDLTRHILETLGGPQDGVLSGDGTVIQAAASAYRSLKLEAAQQAAQKAKDNLKGEHTTEKKKALEQTAQTAQELADIAEIRAQKRRKKQVKDTRVSPTDPDSVYHKLKPGQFRFAFISSLLVNCQRIILAQMVDPFCEKVVVDSMLDMAQRVGGEPVSRLLFDSGYFTNELLTLSVNRDIDFLVLPPEKSPNAVKGKIFRKHEFIYDEHADVLICPAGQALEPKVRGVDKETGPYTSYRTPACRTCPLKAQCTTAERGRVIKRYEGDIYKDVMRDIMEHPVARTRYSQRQATVEPVFGELRGIQDLNRFRRRGLPGVRVEFSLHAMAHNLRRLCKISDIEALLRAFICFLWLLNGFLRRLTEPRLASAQKYA